MSEFHMNYLDLVGYAFFLCCFIPLWVFLVLGWQFISGYGVLSVSNENNFLEFFWTFVPTLVVAVLCYFNIGCVGLPKVVCSVDSVLVVGNQWYWGYAVEHVEGLYDSVMLDFIDSVDKPLRLNCNKVYELLVTSADVIHSFSIPAYNIKLDGIPGRINNTIFCPNELGVFVGYCSELCGAGHAYMPIVLEVVKGS